MKPNWKNLPGIGLKVIALSLLFCFIVIVANALLNSLLYRETNFWKLLIIDVPVHEYFMRLLVLVSFVAFGILVLRLFAGRFRPEGELPINEARLSATLRNISEAIVAVDIDDRITYMNPTAGELTGWSENGANGKSFDSVLRFIDQFTGKRLVNPVKGILKNGAISEAADRTLLIKKDGSKIPVDFRTTPITEDSGKICGAIAVFRDSTEKKNAEDTLRTSVETARALLNAPPDTSMLLDIDGKILALNEAAAMSIQDQPEILIGTCVYDYFPAELAASRKSYADRVFETGKSVRFEDERSGFIYDNTLYPVFNAKGEIDKIAVFAADITERKKTEKALKDSEVKFRNVADSSPMGMHFYRLEPDGRLIFEGANPAADKLLGIKNSQFIGKTIEEAFPGSVGTEIPERYRAAAEKGTTWQSEQVDYVDEQIRGAFQVVAFQTTKNRMVALFFDITARKIMEMELKESEEKFRNVAEQSPNMIFINKLGQVVFVNKKCEEIMGYTREEFLSPQFDFLSIIAPDFLQKIKADFERHLKGEEVGSYEYALITKDGRRINSIINTKLIKYGGESSILGIVTDITERKKAEELREKLIADLQKAANEIKTLSGLIPICASCKKIRDDKGYWGQIETYIMERSDAEFSHGLCPECSKKLYPDL